MSRCLTVKVVTKEPFLYSAADKKTATDKNSPVETHFVTVERRHPSVRNFNGNYYVNGRCLHKYIIVP